MLLFRKMTSLLSSFTRASLLVAALLALAGCQFQPLYGENSLGAGGNLSQVDVSQVNSRVGQQVRNHLIFLLDGGNGSTEKTHEARLRVSYSNKQLVALEDVEDSTAGTITVTVSYDLIDLSTGKAIARGARNADASYDRTGQVFANVRAERDAENRAAKEAAEALRLAIAADLNRT